MTWSFLKPRSLLVRILLLLFAIPWLFFLGMAFVAGWTVMGRGGAVAMRSNSAFGFYFVCAGYALIAAICLLGALAPNPKNPPNKAPEPTP